jgi:CheY-like chemotaxis protein
MSRRELVERSLIGVGAGVCLLLALALGLLARDVVNSRSALSKGDVEYRISPEKTGLWRTRTVVPFGLAVSLLGTEDDVAVRRGVRSVLLARLDDPTVSVSDPRVALLRNDAQARLDAIVADANDPKQRSRAAELLGVVGLARLVSETQDRVALLSATVANLQLAIALDPGNDEAKYNLELALQRARGIQLTEGAGGQNPSPGGSGSSGAGAGDPGSGY